MRAAVVVGCSRYDAPEVADLQYAHSDAEAFAQRLATVTQPDRTHITTLRDGATDPAHAPTRANVLRALATLPRVVPEPVDTLYFFFSGHGFHSARDGCDYLLVADSLGQALEETSVRFELVLRLLDDVGAQHVLLFFDACRAVTAGGKSGQPSTLQPDVANLCPPGFASFCSCEPGAVSYESDELGAGLFTAALAEGLSEAGRCVTVAELDRYLGTAVPELSRRTGKPPQRAHTRVEPLSVQDLEVVSPLVRNTWRSAVRIGQEIRRPARPPGVPRGGFGRLLAIDFGTSYSAAAVADSGGPVRLVPAPDGRTLVPSVVTFRPDLDYWVGGDAVEAERYAPGRTVRHVKRHLGTDRMVSVGDQSVPPEVVASLVVRSLAANAAEFLGRPAGSCLVGYPANFSIRQANALLRAFELAGIDVLRMVGEPNIAAILLVLAKPGAAGDCLIVDLGGGTLDVAVVEVADGICTVKAVSGSNELGGLDYDEALLGLARRRLTDGYPGLVLSEANVTDLRTEVERAKRTFGSRDEAVLVVGDVETDHGFADLDLVLTRDDARSATVRLDAEVRRVVETAVEDARLRAEIGLVLLAGQGGKIFSVREVLHEVLAGQATRPEFVEEFRELAVVRGLAEYSRVLDGLSDSVLLLDLTHRGIGLRGARPASPAGDGPAFGKAGPPGEGVLLLVDRLTTIPTKRSEVIRFQGAADQPVTFSVVERARSAGDEVLVGTVSVPAPGQEVEAEATLDVDANSTMVLDFRDLTNRTIHRFQLNQQYRPVPSLSPYEHVDLVLDGWAVYPGERLRADPGESSAPAAPARLATLDVQRELGVLRDYRERWELELARAPSDLLTRQVARARLTEGRLLRRAGDPDAAAATVLSGLAALVDPRSPRQWDLVGELCAAAGAAVRELPAEHRRTRVESLVDTLRAAFAAAAGRSPWAAEARWRAVEVCRAELRQLGAAAAADRLE